MELSDKQQMAVRTIIHSDLVQWERLAKENADWPYAKQRVKEVAELLDLFRKGEISVTVPEHTCDRCGYTGGCVCGDPEFEQWNSIELKRASEAE